MSYDRKREEKEKSEKDKENGETVASTEETNTNAAKASLDQPQDNCFCEPSENSDTKVEENSAEEPANKKMKLENETILADKTENGGSEEKRIGYAPTEDLIPSKPEV